MIRAEENRRISDSSIDQPVYAGIYSRGGQPNGTKN